MKNYQPAFPIPKDRDINHHDKNGVTVRDYFAAKAMQALITRVENGEGSTVEPLPSAIAPGNKRAEQSIQWIANRGYAISDAMLLEREKEQP